MTDLLSLDEDSVSPHKGIAHPVGTMPGWNIVADLTPPELITARRLSVLRRRIGVGLVLAVLMCAALYARAWQLNGTASDSSAAVAAQTTDLQRQAAKYAPITALESRVDAIRAQVAAVMLDDVDVPHVIALIRAAVPSSVSIQSVALTLTPVAAGTGSPSGLDASGHAEIGTVAISGSGHTLDDLPNLIDRLAKITGVVNPLPGSNSVSAGKSQFSVTISLTDLLYSHRYDVANTGGH